jgi:hypothetical protein
MDIFLFRKVISMSLCIIFMHSGVAIGQAVEQNKRTYAYDIRALHLTLMKSQGPNDPVKQTKAYVISTITKAAKLGYNVVILQVTGSIKLQRTPAFASQWAYSVNDIKDIIEAARSFKMEVIPEIKLLTKQEFLMKKINKDLMLNEQDYDPTKNEVYPIIFNILDEIIQIFSPNYIHIGHDEVYGVQRKDVLPEHIRKQKAVTERDYLADVQRIHNYLKKRRIKTIMWADMLLSPKIFNMYDPSEASAFDDYASLIDQLPRDIILCDWHYTRNPGYFPSYKYLQDKGYTTWGAVWKEPSTIHAFATYIAKWGRKNEGLIATTWWPFVIQDNDTINHILEDVAATFSR